MPIFTSSEISTRMIDRTYGHLAHDSEEHIGDLLDSRRRRSGVFLACDNDR